MMFSPLRAQAMWTRPTGFTEILAPREEWKAAKGEDYDLREFHDKFLSYGSASVSVIRDLMMEEKQTS